MHSADPVASVPAPDDRTARARIRDAAISAFGESGFDAPVREVAQRAGVSAPLVMHHFGTKENLREVCDERIAALVAEAKRASAVSAAADTLLAQLADVEAYGWILGYVMRSMQHGGPLARQLFDLMVADALEYIEAGVRAGTIRESSDPAARARYLTASSVGQLLVLVGLSGPGPGTDFGAIMRHWTTEFLAVSLEHNTYGFFTDDSLLRAYLADSAGHTTKDLP